MPAKNVKYMIQKASRWTGGDCTIMTHSVSFGLLCHAVQRTPRPLLEVGVAVQHNIIQHSGAVTIETSGALDIDRLTRGHRTGGSADLRAT